MALPQKHRLRGSRVFERLYRQGDRLHAQWITLRVLKEVPNLLGRQDRSHPASDWRCAVVVSAKVSKMAVHRNQLRRRVHQFLMTQPPVTKHPIWLVFSLKPGSFEADQADLLGECESLLQKARLR